MAKNHFSEFEVFDGKTFDELLGEIHQRSVLRQDQIDSLIADLRTLMKGIDSYAVLAPMVVEYLDVSVKNDEQLVKLASVVQRFLNSISSGTAKDDEGNSLHIPKDEIEKIKDAVARRAKNKSLN